MKRKTFWMSLSLLAAAMLFSANLAAQPGFGGGRGGFGGPGGGQIHEQLTEEQRTQLHETISQMRENSATREEIHAEVEKLFQSWGIEMPAGPQMRGNRMGRGQFGGAKLTEEQRTELQAKREELRAAGATREEIHEAISALFESWGIEKPERPQMRGNRMGRGQFGGAKLTEELRAELQAKRDELRAAGATREEIHEAISALFENWGIEAPVRGFRGRRGGHRGFAGPQQRLAHFVDENTTVDQRKELYAKHDELWENGATHEEMRDTAKALLASWGIEKPDTTAHYRKGPRRTQMEDQLTQDQRIEVRAKIKEMRIAGKSREEIHDAVAEIIKGYGVALPEKPGFGPRHNRKGNRPELTDEQRAALYAKQQELRAAGATHKEMREARVEMMKAWGFEPPQRNNNDQQSGENPEKTGGKNSGIQARNFPNPFNPETTITYTLEDAATVKVSVFNLQGQEIRVLFEGNQSAGEQNVRWDGKLTNGETASSGTYIYRIDAGGNVTTNRMVLMK